MSTEHSFAPDRSKNFQESAEHWPHGSGHLSYPSSAAEVVRPPPSKGLQVTGMEDKLSAYIQRIRSKAPLPILILYTEALG